MRDLLFVYGTLHPDRAPAEIALTVDRFVSMGQATVRGRLYQFAEYPAMQLHAQGDRVQGEIFHVAGEDAWAALDAYEGYRPDAPESSLFVRVRAAARRIDGSGIECWVYVYAREFPPA